MLASFMFITFVTCMCAYAFKLFHSFLMIIIPIESLPKFSIYQLRISCLLVQDKEVIAESS